MISNMNKNEPVMVTGATGYVAGALIKKLLENGMVRASMPFENEEYVGFRLLIEYKKEFHVCYFKVLPDSQELQTCEKLIE